MSLTPPQFYKPYDIMPKPLQGTASTDHGKARYPKPSSLIPTELIGAISQSYHPHRLACSLEKLFKQRLCNSQRQRLESKQPGISDAAGHLSSS